MIMFKSIKVLISSRDYVIYMRSEEISSESMRGDNFDCLISNE